MKDVVRNYIMEFIRKKLVIIRNLFKSLIEMRSKFKTIKANNALRVKRMQIVNVQKVPVLKMATNNVIIQVIYLHNTKTILSIVSGPPSGVPAQYTCIRAIGFKFQGRGETS